jgi:hypothetical protein
MSIEQRNILIRTSVIDTIRQITGSVTESNEAYCPNSFNRRVDFIADDATRECTPDSEGGKEINRIREGIKRSVDDEEDLMVLPDSIKGWLEGIVSNTVLDASGKKLNQSELDETEWARLSFVICAARHFRVKLFE